MKRKSAIPVYKPYLSKNYILPQFPQYDCLKKQQQKPLQFPHIVSKWTHSLLTQPHSAVFLFGVNHLGPNEGGDSSPKGDLRLKQ